MSFSTILLTLILVLAVIAIIIAGVYNVKTASDITSYSKWSSDTYLTDAHKYATWASVVCWIGLAIIIGVIIFYIIYQVRSGAQVSSSIRILIIITVVLNLIFLFVAFILSYNTFSSLSSSPNLNSVIPALKSNYIATIIEIFAFAFVLCVLVGIIICAPHVPVPVTVQKGAAALVAVTGTPSAIVTTPEMTTVLESTKA